MDMIVYNTDKIEEYNFSSDYAFLDVNRGWNKQYRQSNGYGNWSEHINSYQRYSYAVNDDSAVAVDWTKDTQFFMSITIVTGGIVQRGTHQELMTNGIYADFVNVREKAITWKLAGYKIHQ